MARAEIHAEMIKGVVYRGAKRCKKMLAETIPAELAPKLVTLDRNALEFSLVVLFCTKLGFSREHRLSAEKVRTRGTSNSG